VDLDVEAGECLVLQGPSDSGKSTVLRRVCGRALADERSILVRVGDIEVDVARAGPRAVLAPRRSTLGLATFSGGQRRVVALRDGTVVEAR